MALLGTAPTSSTGRNAFDALLLYQSKARQSLHSAVAALPARRDRVVAT